MDNRTSAPVSAANRCSQDASLGAAVQRMAYA